jgi:uncharacterized protein (TIGR02246 family)
MSLTTISSAEHEAIAATNQQFSQAFSGGDLETAVDRTYTRDARVLPPGGDEIRGRDAIRAFWPAAAAQLGVTRVQLETTELRPAGQGICEIGRGVLTTAGGMEQVVKYVVLWKQEDGDWRIDVDIWN